MFEKQSQDFEIELESIFILDCKVQFEIILIYQFKAHINNLF